MLRDHRDPVSCGVTSVAMEATGGYWIPLCEILEARGFAVVLVNAKRVNNVPWKGAQDPLARRIGAKVQYLPRGAAISKARERRT
jgi:hypothetical protein